MHVFVCLCVCVNIFGLLFCYAAYQHTAETAHGAEKRGHLLDGAAHAQEQICMPCSPPH
jgi:hypothetical protein